MKLSDNLQTRLRCPSTGARLKRNGAWLEPVSHAHIRYPIVEGIPILIDETKSVFSISDFTEGVSTTFKPAQPQSALYRLLERLTPTIGANIRAAQNYATLLDRLPHNANILIIGGSIKGNGTDAIYASDSFDLVGSDVSFGPCTTLISDAHDIPFEDETFDCVIVQAVLEHVLDPHRCVRQAHRVLQPDGLIYAETPFMQQVHMPPYDFTRFTHLGHRRLFRYFEEIGSGPVCGPGMALAWSYAYFLRSFTTSRTALRLLSAFARVTSFYLKYFDYYLIDKPGAVDAASALYFMGRKSDAPLSDRDLIQQFKGL